MVKLGQNTMPRIATKNKTLKIKNFGIINEADIEISPLTVFIGHNSSGKSFAAKLIHCLSLTPDENISEIGLKHVSDSFIHLNENNRTQINELTNNFNDYIKTNPTTNSKPLKIPVEKINSIINQGIIFYLADIISEMITNQFDKDLNNLITFNEEYFKITIRDNELYKQINENLELNIGKIIINSDEELNDNAKILMKVQTDDENFLFNIESLVLNKSDLEDFTIFLLFYQSIGLHIFKNLLLENSFYIPAERSELIDNKLLTRKIQNKSDISKNQSEIIANILNIDSSEKSIFYDIACELEKEFSNVNIDIDNTHLFNTIKYNIPEITEEIDSTLLSTSIHEITIFIIYLKYILKKGDLVIIEEPEAHLHPVNQRILVKYFIKAINKGLKILITTHSDYIISQLDNFINLNNVNSDKLSELNYSKDEILDSEGINIYNFKKDSEKTFKAEKIIIDEEGFIEDNFSKITEDLYDETIKIRNLIK